MKRILKSILPPILINFLKYMYFFFLIKFNKFTTNPKNQDLKIYDEDETADRLTYWGRNNAWNEILMFVNNKKGKILDIACGNGLNIKELEIHNPKVEFYGCDISQKLINIAIKDNLISPKKLKCIDATQMNYGVNYFDYSFSIGSLEHFTEEGLDKVIRNIYISTKKISYNMVPVSKKDQNEGWIKTYQTFHNNSTKWWLNKFSIFDKVLVINSSWEDFISVGKWFVCIKKHD